MFYSFSKYSISLALFTLVMVMGGNCTNNEATGIAPTPEPAKRVGSLGRVGNQADAQTTTSPGIVLMGGSTEVDEAMKWMIEKSGGGDFVVIRTSNRNGYNTYLPTLGQLNSVETFQIDSRTLANDTTLNRYIREAEALFIAGGDQSEYVAYWKNTALAESIDFLINQKGIPVGGTSAGCAILGEVVFNASQGTIRSNEALANPYDRRIALTRDGLFSIDLLRQVVTDTHYDNPDRRGRHLVFLARALEDWDMALKGIGIEERTALCIEEDGKAYAFGEGKVYFLKPNGEKPEKCIPGSPLTWDANQTAVATMALQGSLLGTGPFMLDTWETAEGVLINQNFFYAIEGIFGVNE